MATQPASSRVVTLVLCRRDGAILGGLAPFEVDVPWWQETGPVVVGARLAHDIDVVILRLLAGEQQRLGAGGRVTYLAEVGDNVDVAVLPWVRSRDPEERLRASWARPGGPAEDLAWADAALALAGTPRTADAVQVRSWNLSSLWRLARTRGAAWLKVVPPFFAHEGAILVALGADRVPEVLASDGARTLLADIPGDDLYGVSGELLLSMVDLLVDLQTAWVGRVDDLLELGLPDWRRDALTVALADLVARWRGRLPEEVAVGLDGLLDGLAARCDHIDACGLPDTLVHGDFHPGNLRSAGPGHLVLLDWGDSGIGHPMLDQPAFLERLSPADRQAVRQSDRTADAVAASGTSVTNVFGIGPTLTAVIVGHTGHVGRFPTAGHYARYNATAPIEASSGPKVHHRPNPRGNRHLNHALHIAAVTQIRNDTPGRAYLDRKVAEGKTRKEAMRALKRRISDAVYRQPLADARR